MTSNWQDFIAAQPQALATRNYIAPADDIGLILVTGDEAQDFLQNQLSNDISLIDESHFQFSAYSTPKGRMLGIFRIVRISNGYILITPRSMVLDLMQCLHRYVVQAKVALADASAHFSRFIVQTDNQQIIEDSLLPTEPGKVYQDDDLISLQLESPAGERRYLLLYLSEQLAITQWTAWAALLSPAGFQSFRLSEIKAGIPVIYAQTSEAFVLQMSNLNVLNGVSFKKGCYPGQEIVARMQYLGTLKRRMFLARLESSKLPLPGDEVVVQGKASADGSGKIVDAELDEDGNCHFLYIAQISKAENGQLELLDQPGIVIENIDLPYSIDS